MAGSAPVPAGHQGPSERSLESSYAGQEPLLRPEPRGSVVVVHAQERAGTGAAGAGAETHNIHAFVHPREEGVAFDLFVPNRERGGGGGKDQSVLDGEERKRKGGGGGSHLLHRLTGGGGGGEKGDDRSR